MRIVRPLSTRNHCVLAYLHSFIGMFATLLHVVHDQKVTTACKATKTKFCKGNSHQCYEKQPCGNHRIYLRKNKAKQSYSSLFPVPLFCCAAAHFSCSNCINNFDRGMTFSCTNSFSICILNS